MPEMRFAVRWSDGGETDHYSPSLVMHDFLSVGESYSVAEFVARTSEALAQASERVRQKYGFACTSALHEEQNIARLAAGRAGDSVEVLRMEPPFTSNEPAA